MKVSQVSYSQIRNTGNYENQKAEVTIEVNDGESVSYAYSVAKYIVGRALELIPAETPPPADPVAPEAPKKKRRPAPTKAEIEHAREIMEQAGIFFDEEVEEDDDAIADKELMGW